MVLFALRFPERDFLVLGPLDPFPLMEVPMENLCLEEFHESELSYLLSLRQRPSPLWSAPCYLDELALLAPSFHARRALKIDRLGHFYD